MSYLLQCINICDYFVLFVEWATLSKLHDKIRITTFPVKSLKKLGKFGHIFIDNILTGKKTWNKSGEEGRKLPILFHFCFKKTEKDKIKWKIQGLCEGKELSYVLYAGNAVCISMKCL